MFELIVFANTVLVIWMIYVAQKWQKNHPACKPITTDEEQPAERKIWESYSNYEKWEKIKNKTFLYTDLRAEVKVRLKQLSKTSGLSMTTLYRCMRVEREGTAEEKADFKEGKAVYAIVEGIKKRHKKEQKSCKN
jgi:hypothetical protein